MSEPTMERLVCILIILSLFGSSCSVSKRAFRDLSRKVDLIRTSLEQEIGDLKFEVLDLRNQLESERDRADRLEELLNGTGALPDKETSPMEDADRGEVEMLKNQASADIFPIIRTAFQREKERARQFESTVSQKIIKVSDTAASFKSGIEHLRLTVETVADDAQKNARDIEDIQKELTHIRGEVDVSNDAIVDLRDTVENVTDDAQKSVHDVEDIQKELTHIRGEIDVSNDAIVDLQGAVENVTEGAQESARDIEDIQNKLTHIRDDAAANKGAITDLKHEFLLLHAVEMKITGNWHIRHPGATEEIGVHVFRLWELKENSNVVNGCSNLYTSGTTQSGVYSISPDGRRPFSVHCDMTDDGWTVIQRRIDGTVNFTRNWDDYVNGFGDVNGEYWLGLEKIHILAKDGAEIYFDIEKYDGTREYAHYKNFTVHDVTTLYKMNVDASGYSGSIAERFSYHNDMKFSTYDRDNDGYRGNCAQVYGGGGGWWYRSCFYMYLRSFNGVLGKKDNSGIRYYKSGYGNIYVKTITIKLRQRL